MVLMNDVSLGKNFGCVTTISGRQFYPLAPEPTSVSILDIAHSLSIFNRWGGHTNRPFSVGSHSLLVYSFVCLYTDDRVKKIKSLFHDASEAYIGDVIRPIKYIPELYSVYKPIETSVSNCIAVHLGIDDLEKDDEIERADKLALYFENIFLRNVNNISAPLNMSEDERTIGKLAFKQIYDWKDINYKFVEECWMLGLKIT